MCKNKYSSLLWVVSNMYLICTLNVKLSFLLINYTSIFILNLNLENHHYKVRWKQSMMVIY